MGPKLMNCCRPEQGVSEAGNKVEMEGCMKKTSGAVG